MKTIQLKKLELTNYRNIDFIELNFDGNSKIIGENRIGKTNVLEAIYYLLTDKLLDCSSNIALIKPLSDTTKEVRVRGTFLVYDESTPQIPPREITLEKQYGEDWVKTRGTDELVFKGHYCNYLYNGVKQNTLKVYNGLLAEDFGIEPCKMQFDIMQMLVNPFYLGNMGETDKWNDLRASIIELVGNVTNDDVFAANQSLLPIKHDLEAANGRIEQVKKKYDSEINGLKEGISVDEAQIKMLEETPHPSEEELAVAKRGLQECEERIALINNPTVDTVSNDIRSEINAYEAELLEIKKVAVEQAKNNSAVAQLQEEYDKKFDERNSVSAQYSQALSDIHQLKSSRFALVADLDRRKNSREGYLSELKEIDAKIKNVNVETECPTCHRPYEAETIEKHRLEAISELENRKTIILSMGKENKLKMANLEETIKEKDDEITSKQGLADSLKLEFDKLSDALIELKNKWDEASASTDVQKSERQIEIEQLIENKKESLREAQVAFYQGQQNNRALLEEEKAKAEPFRKVINDNEFYIRQMANLDNVRAQKTEHQRSLADAEQKKELIKTFTIEKLKMLDENVSKVFGNIKFQLIKENINGGFDTICKPYIYNVDKDESTDVTWKSGSKSERVITGIAIAECIKARLNLPNLPFLFDEGGEISTETFKTKFKTNSQLICVKIVDNIMTPTVERI